MGQISTEKVLEEAEAYGVDLSLVRERLRLSPTERLQRHQAALELVASLRQAGMEQRRAQDRRVAKGPV